jgi:hypothetical protein
MEWFLAMLLFYPAFSLTDEAALHPISDQREGAMVQRIPLRGGSWANNTREKSQLSSIVEP